MNSRPSKKSSPSSKDWEDNKVKREEFSSSSPHALKGQKLLAQGIALGVIAISKSPCKGKSFINSGILKLLPLQGDRFASVITQGVALG